MLKVLLMGSTVLLSVALPTAASPRDPAETEKKTGQGSEDAAALLSDVEHAALAALVLDRLKADAKGEHLAKSILDKLRAMKKEKHDKKRAAGGKAHDRQNGKAHARQKEKNSEAGSHGQSKRKAAERRRAQAHGLAERDLVRFGRFVNEKLAQGVRGRKLADAIHTRLRELKENANEREAAKEERKEAHPEDDPKPDKAGKGKQPGKNVGKSGQRGKEGQKAGRRKEAAAAPSA